MTILCVSSLVKFSEMVGYANLRVSFQEELVEDDTGNTSGHSTNSNSTNSYISMLDTHQKTMLDRENELLHASDMSADSSSSALRVEIADIDGEESMNLTTTTLKRCKRQILRPYWRLLSFIGWRGFGRESVNSGSYGWMLLNVLYPLFIMILLLYTYVYEVVACQWKLNVNRDTLTTTTTTTVATTSAMNFTTESNLPFMTLVPANVRKNLSIYSLGTGVPPEACEHIMTTYIIPNVMHFVAFILGMYHFRLQENEQLYAIMEKVFLHATPSYNRAASQQKMIMKLRLFMVLGAIWVLITLVMQALYEYAFDFPKLAFFKKLGMQVHWVLFSMEIFGLLVLNSVTLAVVANYVTHCEMILFYVKGLKLRLQEKSTELKIAMKDVLFVKQNISLLNSVAARMTALICVIFAELTILGVCILVFNKNDTAKVWVYRSIFPFVWLSMLCAPLYQAARVNSVCNGLKKIALEMRVFGYKSCSLLELDSFLTFLGHTSMRAKLFHIPILPQYLIAGIVLGAFVLLILFQTSVIGPVNYWF